MCLITDWGRGKREEGKEGPGEREEGKDGGETEGNKGEKKEKESIYSDILML